MKFEILISTMFKYDMSFLKDIFLNNKIEDYNILVVNQTTKDKLLHSDNSKIRVFNSFERGTSASRNLAIKNAQGEYCLFGDDDIIYEPNFEKTILKAFDKYYDACLLSFEATTGDNKELHTKYPNEGKHNKDSLRPIHMIVMAFRREKLLSSKILFNTYFSLGGKFSGGTEYVFLRNAYANGVNAYHISKTIVHHQNVSSGKLMGSDRSIHTSAARMNHFSSNWYARLWLVKYTVFLLRKKHITFNTAIPKFKIGLKGIKEYNILEKKGLISRQK